MASVPQLNVRLSLDEFLRLPGIDDQPYLEYIDGKVEAKVSPQKKHSLIATGLIRCLDAHAMPIGLGCAFVELRCTFAGRSIIPDVVFLLRDHVPLDVTGEVMNETLVPPDIHIEIISPDQSPQKAREKLRHSTSHGCPLGWLIDPERKTVDIYRPGQPMERLPAEGFLDGEPVIPGFRLAVTELFSWTKPFIVRPQGERPQSPEKGSS